MGGGALNVCTCVANRAVARRWGRARARGPQGAGESPPGSGQARAGGVDFSRGHDDSCRGARRPAAVTTRSAGGAAWRGLRRGRAFAAPQRGPGAQRGRSRWPAVGGAPAAGARRSPPGAMSEIVGIAAPAGTKTRPHPAAFSELPQASPAALCRVCQVCRVRDRHLSIRPPPRRGGLVHIWYISSRDIRRPRVALGGLIQIQDVP